MPNLLEASTVPAAYSTRLTNRCAGAITVFLTIFFCSGWTNGACSLSAATGAEYHQVSVSVGGVSGTTLVEIDWPIGTGWRPGFYVSHDGTYIYPFTLPHNDPISFRLNNGGDCVTSAATATTKDVGQPWLSVKPGPANNVYLQSGAVNPDMNSAVEWSTDGTSWSFVSSWQRLPQNGVDPPQLQNISPGVTNYFRASISLGAETRYTQIIAVRLVTDQDLGSDSCPLKRKGITVGPAPESVGKPVNVINGNMYLSQIDYQLPGTGRALDLTRSYNSLLQVAGKFGLGWTTEYDQYLTIIDSKNIRLQMQDGRGVYFTRATTSASFWGMTPGFPGLIAVNGDGTYTLTFNDGTSNNYSSTGKLLWEKDTNGNQTTINYDGSGVLTGVTDPFGRTLSISIGSNGYVSQISDSLGTIATYDYFPSTNLLKTVTYQDGSKYQFEYDTTSATGKTLLQTVKDALGNTLETHLYDSQARATTSEEQGSQNKYTLDYSNSTFTTVTDGLGRQTKYYFDRTNARNVVKKVEGLCGCGGGGGSQATQYFYDDQLNVVKKTDALGRDTTYTYDSNSNVTSITDPLGTRSFTYNSFGQVLTYRDRIDFINGLDTVTNTFNSSGNVLTMTRRNVLADSSVRNETTTYTYTSIGQLETVKDAMNYTTTLGYDTQGRLNQITDANNKSTTLGYDARARVTSRTNALNETTAFEYDGRNRLKKITYPDTNFETLTYDLGGRRTGLTDARNNTTTYGYDTTNRLTSITDALNHTTSFGYDAMSNLTSQTDALANTTNYTYDDFNRLSKRTYPASTQGATRLEENFTYDLNSDLKTRVDTAGHTTSYDYDTGDRLTKITDPLLNVTQFEYNARSQMTKVTDALNQQYLFAYDVPGHVLSETRAGSTVNFEYDAVGNRTTRIDYLGQQTSYQYDSLNRLLELDYDGSVGGSYTYDDLSRLSTAVNDAGSVAFSYDNRGRVKTETDVFGHVIEYRYDANGNRDLLKLDGADYASYAYNNADRLTTMSNDADNTNVAYGYDTANRLTSRSYTNGVNTTYEYDGMSRLTRLKDVNSTSTLFDRQYSYNAASKISQIAEPGDTRTFGYDSVDRLTTVTDLVNGSEFYTYDAVGNRTSSHLSSTYNYDPFNLLTSTDGSTYDYDANGNMTNGGFYEWDYENRLTGAPGAGGLKFISERYVYDALGRRVSATHSTNSHVRSWTTTNFTYEGQDVLMDDTTSSSQSGSTLTKYLNGPGIDNKVEQTNDDGSQYFIADHLGSTNGLTDSSGSLTASNSYDSFGNATNTNFPTRYQFTGREFDQNTGLQFNRARWYDPAIGRFISEDPIGFAGGDANLYGYVLNSPAVFDDPNGLQRQDRDRPGDFYPGMLEPYNPNRPGRTGVADDMRAIINYLNSPSEPQCGPSGHPFREWLVPDTIGSWSGPFGSDVNLIPACTSHDSCYSSCGMAKHQCDVNLGNDVTNACVRAGGNTDICRFYGDTYYEGVHSMGNDAYQSAQEQSACTVCKLPAPEPDPLPAPCTRYGGFCK